MGYSVAKMIEFAFTYILNNELLTKKYNMPDHVRTILVDYMTKRIEEIRAEHK